MHSRRSKSQVCTFSPHSLYGISHDVWSYHESDLLSLNVCEVKFRESSCLQILPRCSGNHASIPKIVPQWLEHMLEEICPRGGIRDNMFHKVEGSTL